MASHVPAARYASPATPTLLSAVAEDRLRAVVREAAAQAGFDRRYEAPEVVAALEAATSLRPDLCVLDLTLVDDLSGTLELLVSCSPRTSVVVMAPNGDGTGVLAAFSSGARGYAT